MKRPIIIGALALAAVASSALAAPYPIGRWTQASDTEELVLKSKIKLQPSAAFNTGTGLGGSVGFGSMTNTTVVTEPVRLQTKRRMQLSIDDQGAYQWTTTRTYQDGKCSTTVTRETEGEVAPENGQLTFAVVSGTETLAACGRITRTKLPSSRETYAYQQSGGSLMVIDKTQRWVFRR